MQASEGRNSSSIDKSLEEKQISGSPDPKAVDNRSDYHGEGPHGDGDDDSLAGNSALAGVTRTEAVNKVLSTYGVFTFMGMEVQPLKFLLLFCLFLQGYTTGLGGQISQSIQTYAANDFKNQPGISSLNTVKSVVASSVVVAYARLSDRFGRMEMWIFACVFYTVGNIISAATPNFNGLYAGVVMEQFGYSGFRFLSVALTADISAMRDRTFAMNIFLIPVIINTWISGNVVDGIAGTGAVPKWRWGYGIFCIIVPFATMLLCLPYIFAQHIAAKQGILPPFKFRKPNQTLWKAILEVAHDIDVIGVILFSAALTLVLLPLTLAGGVSTKWHEAHIIVMIVVGGCCGIAFVIWEFWFAHNAFFPKTYFKDPTIYSAFAVSFVWRVSIMMQLEYLITVLMVGFDQSKLSAQRIGQLYNFLQSCTNMVIGIIMHFYPHPKLYAVTGSLLGMMGTGLLYKYRTAYHGGIHGLIGAEVVIGIGGGMMRFPMWTLVHAATSHAYMATVTGIMMSLYQVGDAVSSAVAGAIWTQKLAKELTQKLGPQLGMQIYKSPLSFLTKYPFGSQVRDEIVSCYAYIQHLLVAVAIAFAALNVFLVFAFRNYTVGKERSWTPERREAEREAIRNKSFLRNLIGF